MPSLVTTQAQQIGASLSAVDEVAFPIAIIIPIAELLLQLLGNCWTAHPQSTDVPSVHVADHYNAETGEFDSAILDQVRGQTRKAIRLNARQNSGARLKTFSEAQIKQISTVSLKQIMQQEPAYCTSCMIEISMG